MTDEHTDLPTPVVGPSLDEPAPAPLDPKALIAALKQLDQADLNAGQKNGMKASLEATGHCVDVEFA